jgi:hypothetical protein
MPQKFREPRNLLLHPRTPNGGSLLLVAKTTPSHHPEMENGLHGSNTKKNGVSIEDTAEDKDQNRNCNNSEVSHSE